MTTVMRMAILFQITQKDFGGKIVDGSVVEIKQWVKK